MGLILKECLTQLRRLIFSFESLNITTTSGGTTLSPGEFWYATPTLAWEGTLPDSFATGEPQIHGEIKFPNGTVYESINWTGIFTNSANSVDNTAKTISLSTWNRQLYTATDWPVGQYTATFTADYGNALDETNESDNVITGTFTVAAPVDTTPPVLTLHCCAMPGDTTENITKQATNSTGYNVGFTVTANDDEDGWATVQATLSCSPAVNSLFPIGVTTVTCTATDSAGNTGTKTFTVTVTLEDPPPDTTPPVLAWYVDGLSSPENITRQATNSTGFNVNFVVVANDSGDSWSNNSSPVSCSPPGNSLFPIGVTTVTCTATDSAGNIGTGTFTVTVTLEAVPQAQLTMNSPNISEFDNYGNWAEPKVKYNPTGSFNFDDFYDTNNLSSCLSVQVLKPDGTQASITYDTACVQHFAYNYNFAGYINDAFNASGWTMKICSTAHNVCVEQNFTISFTFLDADYDATPASYHSF